MNSLTQNKSLFSTTGRSRSATAGFLALLPLLAVVLTAEHSQTVQLEKLTLASETTKQLPLMIEYDPADDQGNSVNLHAFNTRFRVPLLVDKKSINDAPEPKRLQKLTLNN